MRVAPPADKAEPRSSRSTSKVVRKSGSKSAKGDEAAEATESPNPPGPANSKSTDTKVELSREAKKASAPEASSKATLPKELNDAQTLLDHVGTGKLGEREKDLALKRVEDLLKKYRGNA